jgi:hypothetical protein
MSVTVADKVDEFIDGWVEVAPYARNDLSEARAALLEVIEGVVDDAYMRGYNDGKYGD